MASPVRRYRAFEISGGVAGAPRFRRGLRRRVRFIAPVLVVRGNSEMKALAEAALDVYKGIRIAEVY